MQPKGCLESDPYRRLSYTWHTFTPEWAAAYGVSDEHLARVASERVHAGDARADEARRLLDLRYRLAALAADEYCAAGFCTVVQDNIFGADVVTWLRAVRARPRHLVVLRPSVETVRSRDAARRALTGKIAYRPGEFGITDLDGFLGETPRIGLWLDTSAQTAERTVAEILRRRSEALVPEHF